MGRGLRAGVRRRRSAGCCCRARRSARTHADPGRALRATASRRPTCPTATPTRSATASAGRSRSSPTTARCSGATATTSSRRPSRTCSSAARRPPLPHGDLDRARRRAAADPRRRPTRGWRRRAPRGTATPAASSSPPTPSTRARSRRCCARSRASPTVVLHTDPARHAKLAGVRALHRPLDRRGQHGQRGRRHPAPARRRLRQAAQTPLIFRQIVGRFVRTIPGRPADMSWLYLPADPVLRAHAGDIEGELRHVLRPPRRAATRTSSTSARARARPRRPSPTSSSPSPPTSPRSWRSSAAAGRRPRRPAIVPSFAPAVAEPDEAEMPAYERRAPAARQAPPPRRRPRRREGRPHAEINAWLNRATASRGSRTRRSASSSARSTSCSTPRRGRAGGEGKGPRRDSNSRRSGLKPTALTTELRGRTMDAMRQSSHSGRSMPAYS